MNHESPSPDVKISSFVSSLILVVANIMVLYSLLNGRDVVSQLLCLSCISLAISLIASIRQGVLLWKKFRKK